MSDEEMSNVPKTVQCPLCGLMTASVGPPKSSISSCVDLGSVQIDSCPECQEFLLHYCNILWRMALSEALGKHLKYGPDNLITLIRPMRSCYEVCDE